MYRRMPWYCVWVAMHNCDVIGLFRKFLIVLTNPSLPRAEVDCGGTKCWARKSMKMVCNNQGCVCPHGNDEPLSQTGGNASIHYIHSSLAAYPNTGGRHACDQGLGVGLVPWEAIGDLDYRSTLPDGVRDAGKPAVATEGRYEGIG